MVGFDVVADVVVVVVVEGCSGSASVVAAQQRGRRSQQGKQLDREQRGTFADRPGPSLRHGQLHLRGRECRSTTSF